VGITIPPVKPLSVIAVPQDGPRRGFLKNLTIESFGYGPGPLEPGFQFSPGYTASLFNVHGLECPGCVIGPVNRAKFTLPPFGAQATLRLWNGRVEFSSGFAALEAWKPDGTFEPHGLSLYSSSYGDAWLAQREVSGRIALDPTRQRLGWSNRSSLIEFRRRLKSVEYVQRGSDNRVRSLVNYETNPQSQVASGISSTACSLEISEK
jgi:hypothetical protein